MKRALIKKKILKIVVIPIVIILIIYLYVASLVNNNQNYLDSLTQKIKDNYPINEKITYSNEYNNYYIFTTKNKVIVLNNEYSEILNESIATIKEIPTNQELIYKTNKLMFEETLLEENNLIYRYYDAISGEFIKETVMERQ